MNEPAGRAAARGTQHRDGWKQCQRMLHCLSHRAKEKGCSRAHQEGCNGKSSLGLLDQHSRRVSKTEVFIWQTVRPETHSSLRGFCILSRKVDFTCRRLRWKQKLLNICPSREHNPPCTATATGSKIRKEMWAR